MAIVDTPQIIDLQYDGKRHWFNVWRYTTLPELHAALLKAGIRPEADTIAYTDCYETGDEAGAIGWLIGEENKGLACMFTMMNNARLAVGMQGGAIYLLDKSVDTLAHEATHMALGIIARHGHTSVVATVDEEPELSHDLCKLVGAITSQMYAKQRHF